MEPDWSSGVRDRSKCSPEGLRRSAEIAYEIAMRAGPGNYHMAWLDTADRLLAKARDLEARP